MIIIAAQCFPPDVGGIENMMGGLAAAAAAGGERVVVYADAHPDASDDRLPYEVRRIGGWKPLRRRRKGAAVAAAAAKERAALVICDSWKSLEHVPSAIKSPVHCLAHGMEVPADLPPGKARRIRRVYGKAARVIANSRYSADLARRVAPDPERVGVATPPIPPQPEPEPAAVAALERDLGLTPGASGPLVAYVGRLEPRKGVDRVIDAAARLREAYPGLVVAVAGGGDDRARLEAHALSRGAQDRVRFLGRVDEARKIALMARADVFAMPTRREGASVEGFGIVYLEAAWHGTPALAGREGGAADAVLDGQTGRLCDGADPDDVTGVLHALLGDPVERKRMGFLAKAHAREQVWSLRLGDFLAAEVSSAP